jgi:hypothetical protein
MSCPPRVFVLGRRASEENARTSTPSGFIRREKTVCTSLMLAVEGRPSHWLVPDESGGDGVVYLPLLDKK